MADEEILSFLCPSCDAANPPGAEQCHACGAALVTTAEGPRPERVRPARRIRPPQTAPTTGPRRRTFDLKSIMVLIAVLGIGFGILRFAPGLGIFFLALITPALVRTYGYSARRKAEGRPFGLDDRLWHFLTSVSVALIILATGALAFVPTCTCLGFAFASGTGSSSGVPGPWGDWWGNWGWLIIPVAVGLLAAGFATYPVIRQLWPTKE